jgi:uncharacterized protein (TIGR03435 family)
MISDPERVADTWNVGLLAGWPSVVSGKWKLVGAPSLFTALQEQLGLKLESTKAPVDATVIDSIERPTDD